MLFCFFFTQGAKLQSLSVWLRATLYNNYPVIQYLLPFSSMLVIGSLRKHLASRKAGYSQWVQLVSWECLLIAAELNAGQPGRKWIGN